MDNGFDNFVDLSNSIISLNKYFLTNYGWYIIIRVIATIQPKELFPRKLLFFLIFFHCNNKSKRLLDLFFIINLKMLIINLIKISNKKIIKKQIKLLPNNLKIIYK